ncbi:MAG: transposase [bacterium]
MSKRRKFTPQEKLEIVLSGLSSSNGIAEICRSYGISTVQFYQWKDQLIKSAPVIYKRKSRKKNDQEEKLKEQISHKDRVIAIITEENLHLKKNLGI